ncbi:hypothetical protein ARMGADRAFT_1088907 [Armillaria gallica]|uniref:AMP-dependent synthetase/ligase domain-containing protein n=1 Tax=Armillaria gallica TaxID=47427 RepID=A0A2H3CPY7_ARMGA|nr:hypothetical protein ARMGADRAFT_1088907 [Armillaria gallica]
MSVVVVPKFNFKEMLQSIVKHRMSSLMVVPPRVVLLCKDPILKNFDLSNATGVVSMCPVEQKCGMFRGALAPGVIRRVVKTDGTLGDYDEEGELYFRTPAAATEYLNNEAAYVISYHATKNIV